MDLIIIYFFNRGQLLTQVYLQIPRMNNKKKKLKREDIDMIC